MPAAPTFNNPSGPAPLPPTVPDHPPLPPAGPPPCEVTLPDGVELSSQCSSGPPWPGNSCSQALNLACTYEDTTAQEPTALVARCYDTDDGKQHWGIQYAACEHACAPIEGELISVDATSCAQREPQPCHDGLTVQQQLDASVWHLLDAQGVGELLLDSMIVVFQDGCATGFAEKRDAFDTAHRTQLSAALASVRWACAAELGCAFVQGPSKPPPPLPMP